MSVVAYRKALGHLRQLLDALESMDDATRERFLRGEPAPSPGRQSALPAPSPDLDALNAALVAAPDRAAAEAVLKPLKGPALKALVERLGLRAPGRATMAQQRDIIVAATVGTRADAAAIRRA